MNAMGCLTAIIAFCIIVFFAGLPERERQAREEAERQHAATPQGQMEGKINELSNLRLNLQKKNVDYRNAVVEYNRQILTTVKEVRSLIKSKSIASFNSAMTSSGVTARIALLRKQDAYRREFKSLKSNVLDAIDIVGVQIAESQSDLVAIKAYGNSSDAQTLVDEIERTIKDYSIDKFVFDTNKLSLRTMEEIWQEVSEP